MSRGNNFPDTKEVMLSCPHFKAQREKKKLSVLLGGLADLHFWLQWGFNFPTDDTLPHSDTLILERPQAHRTVLLPPVLDGMQEWKVIMMAE